MGRLNSNPIVNIRNTIPNSTKCLLDSESGNTPKPGSQIDRKSCEPIGGLTSLIEQSKEAIESK